MPEPLESMKGRRAKLGAALLALAGVGQIATAFYGLLQGSGFDQSAWTAGVGLLGMALSVLGVRYAR